MNGRQTAHIDKNRFIHRRSRDGQYTRHLKGMVVVFLKTITILSVTMA